MAFLVVQPHDQAKLHALGLTEVEHFLSLPGVILAGHPDRHVLKVQLGDTVAYLKREHCVRWRERFGSFWRGMGWISQSCREYRILDEVRQTGIGCPAAIAAGEHGGRAFLLLRELTDARELRSVLQDPTTERRRLLRALGQAVARIHEQGFNHPDLSSKHVLVRGGGQVHILDWQRCGRRRMSWSRRARGLAALHATIAAGLASPRERLKCLAAYLHECKGRPDGRRFVAMIERHARKLLRRAKVRALLQAPMPPGSQNLIWLQGEGLCVTRQFLDEVNGELPSWLAKPPTSVIGPETRFARLRLQGRQVDLVRRWASCPLAWLWCCLRRWRLTTPEVRQAGTVFLLQRHGITTPRLLAMGQRFPRPWRAESFLLTEPLTGTASIGSWLRQAVQDGRHADIRQMLRSAGQLLRRLHESGHYLRTPSADGDTLVVQECPDRPPRVAIGSLAGVQKIRRAGRARARADLSFIARTVVSCGGNRGDCLRLSLGYRSVDDSAQGARA